MLLKHSYYSKLCIIHHKQLELSLRKTDRILLSRGQPQGLRPYGKRIGFCWPGAISRGAALRQVEELWRGADIDTVY